MSAHLYVVPDDADAEGPDLQTAVPSLYLPRPAHHGGPGEYPLAPPVPAAAAPADGEQPQEHPLDDGQDEEQLLADEAGEQPLPDDQADEDEDQGDVADEDEAEWEPARRAMTLPDLRPYADVPEAARLIVSGTLAVGRLTVEHAPAGGRLLWRGTTATGRALRTATFAIGRALRTATATVAAVVGPPWRALTGWCHGGEGATGPYKRAGVVAAALFAGGNALELPGIVRVGVPAVWFLGFLLTGRSPAEAPAKGKGKAPKGKGKEPAPVSKEPGPPPAEAPVETPAEPVEETPEETPLEDAETPAPDPAEPPAAPPAPAPAGPPPLPSGQALIEALHHLYRGGSGVLHSALKTHLRQPSTRAIREALDGAGIPSRTGVRAGVGAGAPNGPGVHRDDFPPLPLSKGDPQGDPVGAGQSANNNNTNSGEGHRKGFRVDTTDSGFTVHDLSATTRLTPEQ